MMMMMTTTTTTMMIIIIIIIITEQRNRNEHSERAQERFGGKVCLHSTVTSEFRVNLRDSMLSV